MEAGDFNEFSLDEARASQNNAASRSNVGASQLQAMNISPLTSRSHHNGSHVEESFSRRKTLHEAQRKSPYYIPPRSTGNLESSSHTPTLAHQPVVTSPTVEMECSSPNIRKSKPENSCPSSIAVNGSNSGDLVETRRCSICKVINNRKSPYMIKCDSCGYSQHYSCVKISSRIASEITIWHCPPCARPSIHSGSHITEENLSNAIIPSDFAATLAMLKTQTRIYKRLPKAVRATLAGLLTERIDAVLNQPSPLAWWKLLVFPYQFLKISQEGQDPGKNRPSSSTVIRENIATEATTNLLNHLSLADNEPEVPNDTIRSSTRLSNTIDSEIQGKILAKRVHAKISDNDWKGGLRILTSSDRLANPNDPATIRELNQKHPPAPANSSAAIDPPDDDQASLLVDEEAVLTAISSMPSGSSGGLDALRPLVLQQLLSNDAVECGRRLLASLTKLTNVILSGNVPDYAQTSIFGASLIALEKETGGIRPIAVGCIYRRLACRMAAHHVSNLLADEFSPIQLGVGVKGGCESAVHAIRDLVESASSEIPTANQMLLKVDVKNAFNTVHREAVFAVVKRQCPEIFKIVHQAYSSRTPLYIGNTLIPSQTGVQQGDPLGPLCFALSIDPIIRTLKSPLNLWYLDDGTLAGSVQTINQDLLNLIPKFQAIGLILNSQKCELTSLFSQTYPHEAAAIQGTLPGVKLTPISSLTILNSPILHEATPLALTKANKIIDSICERVKSLDAHTALFFLSHYSAAPRLNYLLRSAPLYQCPLLLQKIDEHIKTTMVSITNVVLDETAWRQATLPSRFGGLGVRSVAALALPCYISSMNSSLPLVNEIRGVQFSNHNAKSVSLTLAEDSFASTYPNCQLPSPEKCTSQRSWDEVACKAELAKLLSSANQVHKARLLAASSPNTGDWIQALPSSNLGLHMDNETIRVSVALRLGMKICEPHRCRCGRMVDQLGHHGLSCRRSAGRLPRHSNINDIVKRTLSSAGIPSWLEPVGLDRGDGKRPDGLTVFPFSQGKSLTWDSTVSDTFSDSVINLSAVNPGHAADKAESRKRALYSSLVGRYRFEPVSFETTGVMGESTAKFILELGRKVRAQTGDVRETMWLRQRISVAIMRGNSLSVLATCKSAYT